MGSINQKTLKWCEEQNIAHHFEKQIDSTNTWAKKTFKPTSPLSVFLTDHQTHGRGRGTNTWTNSSPGSTLLSTWCVRLSQVPHPIFSIRTGLALWSSLTATWPTIPWAIKAPNDIYVDTGKFAGILIEVEESSPSANAFIGIGANILSSPVNIDQKTFHLDSHESSQLDEKWAVFCNHLVKNFFELAQDAHRSLLTHSELERLLTGLKLYTHNQIEKVLPDGSLVLKNNDLIPWNKL